METTPAGAIRLTAEQADVLRSAQRELAALLAAHERGAELRCLSALADAAKGLGLARADVSALHHHPALDTLRVVDRGLWAAADAAGLASWAAVVQAGLEGGSLEGIPPAVVAVVDALHGVRLLAGVLTERAGQWVDDAEQLADALLARVVDLDPPTAYLIAGWQTQPTAAQRVRDALEANGFQPLCPGLLWDGGHGLTFDLAEAERLETLAPGSALGRGWLFGDVPEGLRAPLVVGETYPWDSYRLPWTGPTTTVATARDAIASLLCWADNYAERGLTRDQARLMAADFALAWDIAHTSPAPVSAWVWGDVHLDIDGCVRDAEAYSAGLDAEAARGVWVGVEAELVEWLLTFTDLRPLES